MNSPSDPPAETDRSHQDTGGTSPAPEAGLESKEKQVSAMGTLPLSVGNAGVRVSVVVEVTPASQAQNAAKRSDENTGGNSPPPKAGVGARPKN